MDHITLLVNAQRAARKHYDEVLALETMMGTRKDLALSAALFAADRTFLEAVIRMVEAEECEQ